MTDQTTAAASALAPAMGIRDILRIRNYRLLWLGQLISEAGDGLTNLTLLLLVNALTGSTAALAGMAIVLAIPPLTIGLIAGTYVDRFDRRRIMLASDILRGIVVLGFVLVGSASSLWLLYILAFVQSAVGTFFTPARGAILPRIVPREGLLAANSLAQATRVVSGIVGSALAGLIVGLIGTFWPAFILDSLTFFVSFALIARLPAAVGTIQASAHAAAGVRGALLVGLRTIGRSRVLSTTILALAVSMLGLGAVNVLFVPFVVRVLQVGPVWLGPVELAQSASMILASGLIGVLARRLAPSSIVTIAMAGVAVTIAAAGTVVAIWQLLVLMFVIGWFVVPLQAAVITILQQSTPDGERGRVMSVVQAAMSAASVLSMGFAGIVGDAIGIREVMFAAGGITGIGFLVALVGYRRHDGARSAVAADPGDAVAADVGDAAAPGMPVA
ncbi:MAG TPA: MFS transporter [Verrucomicrobiae bacterium]|jgi:MFS family permease|nr:MFS transporter [Verrucomicrobiae bacterium]